MRQQLHRFIYGIHTDRINQCSRKGPDENNEVGLTVKRASNEQGKTYATEVTDAEIQTYER